MDGIILKAAATVFVAAVFLYLLYRVWSGRKAARAFELLLDNLEACVCVSRYDNGKLIYVNRKMREEYGLTGNPLGKRCRDAFGCDSAPDPAFCPRQSADLREGTPYTWEDCDPATGKHFRNTSSIIDWPDGTRVHMQHSVNITDLKNAEDGLYRTRQTLRSILDNVPLSIFWKDKDLVYRGCNSMFSRIIELPVDEVLGKTDYEILPANAEKYRIVDTRVIETRTPMLDFDEEIRTSDGSPLWMRTSKVPVYGKDGEVEILLGVTSDITEVKLRELALHESQQMIQAVFNATDEMIFLVDAQARLMSYNHVFAKTFDIAGDEAVGRDLYGWIKIDPADIAILKTIHQQLVSNQQRQRFEFSSGSACVEISACPIIEKGSLFGISVYVKDVTLRKRDEEELARRGKELERALESEKKANNAKSDFLSHMSHEIRTPMNAVIGMAKIARRSQDVDYIHECLDKIGVSSALLLGIINDILDMSKIEANKMELANEPFVLQNMLANVYSLIGVKAGEKQQIFSFHVDEDLAPRYVGDELRLAQVITNLLSNAVKFTPQHGTITLHIGEKKRTADEALLEISVQDTGIGISPENSARLFRPFEQADGSIVRSFGGTGLGLVISKSIVNMMGGDIEVRSEEGKGSTFVFTIRMKIADEGETEMPDVATEIPDLHGRRILVVDDVAINREIVKALLDETGVQMDFAENGRLALECFQQNPEAFDLILMDVQMPEMDGYKATRRLRRLDLPRAADIPVLAMTANAFKEDIDRCIEAGMNDHLAKPVDDRALYGKLAHYLPRN